MTYLELISDCWSRGFDHTNYINYAQRIGDHTKINPHTVSKEAYDMICAGLTLDLEQTIGVDQADRDAGIAEAEEMNQNMLKYGTINKPTN